MKMRALILGLILMSGVAAEAVYFSEFPVQKLSRNEEKIEKHLVEISFGRWQGICTGVVVGPRQILTAGHCFDRDDNFAPTPEEIALRKIPESQLEPGRGFEHVFCGRTGCPEIFSVSNPELKDKPFHVKKIYRGSRGLVDKFNNEWVVLDIVPGSGEALTIFDETSTPPPANYTFPSWLPVQGFDQDDLIHMMIVGYSTDRARGEAAFSVCPSMHTSPERIEYQCSTSGGTSGAPIISTRSRNPVVVGVHSGASRGGAVNSGVSLTASEAAKINALLEKLRAQ